MTWLGCQQAVSGLWRDAGLQGLSEGLGAAELVLGISASKMEQLALFPVSIWQKTNAANLVFMVFYLRTRINYQKNVLLKPKSRTQWVVRIPSLRERSWLHFKPCASPTHKVH